MPDQTSPSFKEPPSAKATEGTEKLPEIKEEKKEIPAISGPEKISAPQTPEKKGVFPVFKKPSFVKTSEGEAKPVSETPPAEKTGTKPKISVKKKYTLEEIQVMEPQEQVEILCSLFEGGGPEVIDEFGSKIDNAYVLDQFHDTLKDEPKYQELIAKLKE